MDVIALPQNLKLDDGRFGSGPTRIRSAQLSRLTSANSKLLGTSHRQAPVRHVVERIKEGLDSLYQSPAGYISVLGNGGASLFWDAAIFSLIEHRAAFGVFGEFGEKFANRANTCPHLATPLVRKTPPGEYRPYLPALDQAFTEADSTPIDTVCYPHNETSTGVMTKVERVGCAPTLTVVDATSAAGAMTCDLRECDAYYFSPQKAFGADGGLWFSFLSPAAVERIEKLSAERWIPPILDLSKAVANSARNQTLNTPAVTTLLLMEAQIDWLLEIGGLAAAQARCEHSSGMLYRWAEQCPWASALVPDVQYRSTTVATIEIKEKDQPAGVGEGAGSGEPIALRLAAQLRANGIVDVEPYRGLGGRHLRIGTFPSVDPSEIADLIRAIEYLYERL